jgi:hypothetical protein
LIATPSSSHSPAAGDSPWSELATLYRRVCLLRARGLGAEADHLAATDLARALTALRPAGRPAGDPELRALFAREEDRVADATVLAEILLPLLREPAAAGASAPAPAALPARAPRPAASAAAPGIADFIDEMISLERRFAPADGCARARP